MHVLNAVQILGQGAEAPDQAGFVLRLDLALALGKMQGGLGLFQAVERVADIIVLSHVPGSPLLIILGLPTGPRRRTFPSRIESRTASLFRPARQPYGQKAVPRAGNRDERGVVYTPQGYPSQPFS